MYIHGCVCVYLCVYLHMCVCVYAVLHIYMHVNPRLLYKCRQIVGIVVLPYPFPTITSSHVPFTLSPSVLPVGRDLQCIHTYHYR